MKLYIKLEEGDKVLTEAHGGTFLVNVNDHCFKSLECRLKDYVPGTRVRADYMGYSRLFPQGKDPFENLPWKKYVPRKASSKAK